MQTKLYRHYDETGQLLYVGISLDALKRLKQHGRAPWADQIARVDIATFPNRAAASRAETWAIGTELPLFNRRKRSGVPMSNAQVGQAVGFTLAEAYRLAAKGDVLSTIDPIEFAGMSRIERRHHLRIMKRMARAAFKSGPPPQSCQV